MPLRPKVVHKFSPHIEEKRRHLQRPLSKIEIEEAQRNTLSSKQAAEYLKVAFSRYKKYAKLYGIYEQHKNGGGKFITKNNGGAGGKHYSLDYILAGNPTKYERRSLKLRLINNGILIEECEMCGFKEKRTMDGKCPLILDSKDPRLPPYLRDNLRLICYNCSYLIGGGMSLKSVEAEINVQDLDMDFQDSGIDDAELDKIREEAYTEVGKNINAPFDSDFEDKPDDLSYMHEQDDE